VPEELVLVDAPDVLEVEPPPAAAPPDAPDPPDPELVAPKAPVPIELVGELDLPHPHAARRTSGADQTSTAQRLIRPP
jgi:hypothetical protein